MKLSFLFLFSLWEVIVNGLFMGSHHDCSEKKLDEPPLNTKNITRLGRICYEIPKHGLHTILMKKQELESELMNDDISEHTVKELKKMIEELNEEEEVYEFIKFYALRAFPNPKSYLDALHQNITI